MEDRPVRSAAALLLRRAKAISREFRTPDLKARWEPGCEARGPASPTRLNSHFRPSVTESSALGWDVSFSQKLMSAVPDGP